MNKLIISTLCLAVLAGCHNSGIRGYWDNAPLLDDDIAVSEDRFAIFAELTTKASPEDALIEMDNLFNHLSENEVAYYLYPEWLDGAFYSIYSPCRNFSLYSRAVERIVSDGILPMDECEQYIRRRDWFSYNLVGDKATVPSYVPDGRRTLFMVLDLGCSSCRQALEAMGSRKDVRKVAIGLGRGPVPETPDWEFILSQDLDALFDIHQTPAYFIVSEYGDVETTYTPVL